MSEKALLFVHALTSLYPGSGVALGAVDLPVQRERHTAWPLIPGSSLKGILRDACRRIDGDTNELYAVFGPETSDAHDHAGALSLTDARILAFPVRSLRGVFAWVTCPAVLERLNRDLSLAGTAGLQGIPRPEKERAACAENSPLLVDGNKMVLEEFEFTRTAGANPTAGWIANHATQDAPTQNRVGTHLAVLHDDDFTHFVRHATEIVARVGLDYERKTVKQGALFFQEFLPAETFFYSLVIAEDSRRMIIADGSRRKDAEKNAAWTLRYAKDHIPPVLQIGGSETIGKGLCALRLIASKEV
jgi:CRISPR-associated protein Cmr4